MLPVGKKDQRVLRSRLQLISHSLGATRESSSEATIVREEMSIDLLHIWPMLLASLAIVAGGLIGAQVLATRSRTDFLWTLALGASLLDIVVGEMLVPGSTRRDLGWSLGQAAVLVLIPIAVGGWRVARLTGRGRWGPLALGEGLLLGLSVGWVLMPIFLVAAFLGVAALTA
jgi:hypothetical protein